MIVMIVMLVSGLGYSYHHLSSSSSSRSISSRIASYSRSSSCRGIACSSSISSRNSINSISRSRVSISMRSSQYQSQSALHAMFETSSPQASETTSLNSLNRLVVRTNWISWWFQIILSVISGVILTFANTVRKGGGIQSLWGSGFAFSTIGVILSFVNAIWTWNFTRLSRRISLKKIDDIKIKPTIIKYCQISVFLSLIGMLITLIGAEQIVGTLASKVLSVNSGFAVPMLSSGLTSPNTLQALDIFLVQANTNVLVAHFVPLLTNIWLQTQVTPSVPTTTSVPTSSSSSSSPNET